MKRTGEDEAFAHAFAKALEPHVDRELAAGKSLKFVAKRLGVTSWGLRKQLAGGTPSVRTVALAYALYRVSVPYGGIKVTRALSRRRQAKQTSERQLLLPFQITTPGAVSGVILKRLPKGVRKYQLRLSITAAS